MDQLYLTDRQPLTGRLLALAAWSSYGLAFLTCLAAALVLLSGISAEFLGPSWIVVVVGVPPGLVIWLTLSKLQPEKTIVSQIAAFAGLVSMSCSVVAAVASLAGFSAGLGTILGSAGAFAGAMWLILSNRSLSAARRLPRRLAQLGTAVGLTTAAQSVLLVVVPLISYEPPASETMLGMTLSELALALISALAWLALFSLELLTTGMALIGSVAWYFFLGRLLRDRSDAVR
jgi:hypothetical protein